MMNMILYEIIEFLYAIIILMSILIRDMTLSNIKLTAVKTLWCLETIRQFADIIWTIIVKFILITADIFNI